MTTPLKIAAGQVTQFQTGDSLPVALGGTGAVTAPDARTNLGAAADSLAAHLAGTETFTGAKTFSASTTVFVATAVSSAVFYRNVSNRWSHGLDGVTEGPVSAGSNWSLQAYDNTGSPLGAYVTVTRATGLVTVGSATISQAGVFTGSGSGLTSLNPANLSGAVGPTLGGTGQTTYALGDTLYASAANTVSKLAGNTTAVKLFKTQTGTGTVSAAPAWAAIVAADVPSLDAAKVTTGTFAAARLGSGTGSTSNWLRGDGSWNTLVAADVPSLDAAKVTTGTFATARLGSGTGSAVNWLRGDGSWSAPGATAFCNGRLTLTSGAAVTTSDVTAATTVYFTPFLGSQVGLYNGTSWDLLSFSEVSLSLSGLTAGKNYDVFAFNNSGTVAIESLVWTNDSTRATALALQNGVHVKSGTPTRRYLGTFRTTATTGQTEDSYANRFLWNLYNPVARFLKEEESTGNWTYSLAVWRPGNNNTANRVNLVVGLQTAYLKLDLFTVIAPGPGNAGFIGIAEDSTTAPHALSQGNYGNYNLTASIAIRATLGILPAAGFHFYQWIEYCQTGTVTYSGDLGTGGLKAGLYGHIEG